MAFPDQVLSCTACDRLGVDTEQCEAMKDVQNVMCEYGSPVIFQWRDEDNVDRDRYGSIKTKREARELTFRCYPIEYNPSIDVLERAGLRHEIRVMIFSSIYDWALNDLTFDDIDEKRMTVTVDDRRYEVADMNRTGRIGNNYLYLVFGLNKV